MLGTNVGPNSLPLNYYSLTSLFLLAERESEIQAFTPTMKWQLRVRLATPAGEFTARLEEAYEISDDGFLEDASQGKEVMNLLKDKTFTVHQVDREEIAIQPPLPYQIAELLQDAFILYGMEPGRVLEAAQQLFSGIEIEGQLTGLITSFVPMEQSVPSGLLEGIRRQIIAMQGEDALGRGGDFESGADFILPIRPDITKETLKDILSKDACDVYGLVWARALASQMKEAVGETIEVEVRAGDDFVFLSTDRSITDKGFMSTYYGYQDRELLKASALTHVEEGQAVENLQIIPEQTMGFPPEFYTFESLFTDLADFSITLEPSTILMLQSMMNGGYLTVTQEGYLRCKENTAKVIKTLNRAIPSMLSANLSAYFAQTVEEAVSGRKPLDYALRQFDQTLMMQGNVLAKVAVPTSIQPRAQTSQRIIKATDEPIAQPTPKEPAGIAPAAAGLESARIDREQGEETISPATEEVKPEPVGETAAPAEEIAEAAVEETAEGVASEPVAGADVNQQAPVEEAEIAEGEEEIIPEAMEAAEISGAEGSEEAQEVFDQPPEEQQPPAEAAAQLAAAEKGGEAESKVPTKLCPDCSRPLLLKEDRFGKYWYCSGHPACRHSESYEKEAGPAMDCPLCDIGKVIIKRTPTGKIFYVCPEQDCEFMAWALPHAIPCQACNSPFLVEKKNISGKRYLRCPRAGCNYMQPLPGEGGADIDFSRPTARKKVRVRRAAKGKGGGGKVRKVRVVRRKK